MEQKAYFFYKIKKKLTSAYLNSYLYNNNNLSLAYSTRLSQNETLRTFSSRTESFKYSFFPYSTNECNKLDNTEADTEGVL